MHHFYNFLVTSNFIPNLSVFGRVILVILVLNAVNFMVPRVYFFFWWCCLICSIYPFVLVSFALQFCDFVYCLSELMVSIFFSDLLITEYGNLWTYYVIFLSVFLCTFCLVCVLQFILRCLLSYTFKKDFMFYSFIYVYINPNSCVCLHTPLSCMRSIEVG